MRFCDTTENDIHQHLKLLWVTGPSGKLTGTVGPYLIPSAQRAFTISGGRQVSRTALWIQGKCPGRCALPRTGQDAQRADGQKNTPCTPVGLWLVGL